MTNNTSDGVRATFNLLWDMVQAIENAELYKGRSQTGSRVVKMTKKELLAQYLEQKGKK